MGLCCFYALSLFLCFVDTFSIELFHIKRVCWKGSWFLKYKSDFIPLISTSLEIFSHIILLLFADEAQKQIPIYKNAIMRKRCNAIIKNKSSCTFCHTNCRHIPTIVILCVCFFCLLIVGYYWMEDTITCLWILDLFYSILT